MNPLTEIWFWLLIISIIGFIISFILFETSGQIVDGKTVIPAWVWVIYFISIILLIAAFIIFCYRMHRHYQHLEMLEACYGIVPKLPAKKMAKCPTECDDPCKVTVMTKVVEPTLILQPLEQPVKTEQIIIEPIEPVNPTRYDMVITADGKTARVY